ncbi:DHA1 family putative efflux transporter-like MFS transporter [Paenibacillus cellulosilyticus]|uniref:DHA1 family putative efflux transporter-like MFS transporter n=1 Tax=Paenibacillus cellulosilyticus TaxID=375489 RepID=A0A2V2YMY3_9BACL|nr:MFS transporter [Paenibacillus cellulosilyticus]PWV95883.1 DHA1 family putative efflux transporter-like MFS transporter [Paenibacillus cellulosilyticus]QKS47752.1 MFS transporter [Paenibacillus cellulosilyticus]
MNKVYLIALAAFFAATAELVISGILSMLAASVGISIAQAGMLVTAYSIGFAVGTPMVIALTSRMSRKRLMLISLLAFSISSLAFALGSHYVILMAIRVIVGASAGVFCVIALGSVAKLVKANQLGNAMGTIALAFSFSMVLGVPIGAVMSKLWGWESIFYALAIGGLLVILPLHLRLPDLAADKPEPFLQQFTVLKNVSVAGPLLLSMLLGAGNSVMLTYIAPFVEHALKLSSDAPSAVLLAVGVIGIAGSKLGGIGIDRYGSVRVMLISLAVTFLSLAAMPLFADIAPAISLALIGVWGFSIFSAVPAINAFIVRTAPSSVSFILSMNTSVTHLGLALGASTGGWLIRWKDQALYHPWLAALFVLLAFTIAALSIQYQRASIRLMQQRSTSQ